MAYNSTRRFEDSKTWASTTITPVMIIIMTTPDMITGIIMVTITVPAATSTHQPILAGHSRSASRSTLRS